jgi:hypothetical protein
MTSTQGTTETISFILSNSKNFDTIPTIKVYDRYKKEIKDVVMSDIANPSGGIYTVDITWPIGYPEVVVEITGSYNNETFRNAENYALIWSE